MQIAIILFYAIICAWAITVIPFFKRAKISDPYLISIFYGKIIVGIAYAILMQKQQIVSGLPTDTWKYFNYSLIETQNLYSNPSQFFKELFTNHYGEDAYTTFWASTGSFWADFKNWFFVTILAFLNVITKGNYVANLVIINFLCFFGWVGIYKLLTQKLLFKPLVAFLITFCIPSTLFWNSGLHKDAFIHNSIGCLLWYIFKTEWKFNVRKTAVVLFHIIIIFSFRYYTLIFVLAGLAGLFLFYYSNFKARIIIISFAVMVFLVIVASPLLPNSLSLPKIYLQKQEEFLKLKANSDFNYTSVPLDANHFIYNIPKALSNVFGLPGLNTAKGISGMISLLEIFGILFFCIVSLFLYIKNRKTNKLKNVEKAFIIFSVLYVFTAALTIGFINVNIGSIVRYRSVLLPFVVAVSYLMVNKFYTNKNSSVV